MRVTMLGGCDTADMRPPRSWGSLPIMRTFAALLLLGALPALAQPNDSRRARPPQAPAQDIWSRPVPSAWDAAAPVPGQPIRRPPPQAWREEPEPRGLGFGVAPLVTFGVGVAVGRGYRGGRHCPW